MMMSEHTQQPPLQQTSSSATTSSSSTNTTVAMEAIAFPHTEQNGAGDTFTALPFDEKLMVSNNTSETATTSQLHNASSEDPSAFFIDTAMLAQQIASVVADEKKLSDNIMDLIPPPVPIVPSAVDLSTSGVQTTTTTASSSSLTTPLAPPPGLLMRALSPPISLLPDFQPLPAFSLNGEDATTVVTTTTSTTTANELPEAIPPPAAITDDRRISTHTALLKKRKSAEAFGDSSKTDHNVATSTAASTALNSLVSSTTATSTSTTHNSNPGPTAMSAVAAVAAAREKVMKEPQSGDLYECIITKRNGGLGLTLACVDDHVQITGLAPDTPAANSGICVGDTLVAVSGLPVRGLQFSTVIGRLKSTSRSSVVLKLRRNPFRQNAGNSAPYRGIKRPARPTPKGSDSSNSANVLSTKSFALETRLGDASLTNGNSGSNGVNGAGESSSHLQVKTEPMNSSYFPTDASILLMDSTKASATAAPTSSENQWRVASEEKDRYYAECRALKHELASAMLARRIEKRQLDAYTAQLQAIVNTFQRDMQTLLSSPPSATTSNNEDLVALRQKLLEVNHALARQQTEILELKERETRHTLPETQRVRTQLVLVVKKTMLQVDVKGACTSVSSTSSVATAGVAIKNEVTPTANKQVFEERLEGIRPSVFEMLFRHDLKGQPIATVPTITLNLNSNACTQLLGWNLREIVSQANVAYVVSVEDALQVRYLRAEEALTISWKFSVQELKH